MARMKACFLLSLTCWYSGFLPQVFLPYEYKDRMIERAYTRSHRYLSGTFGQVMPPKRRVLAGVSALALNSLDAFF